ncbi:hypothetical protein M9979_08390 [Sphingomonas sp. RP10(2022)]|uniref:Secreted protein n=1 Tax=Sphingomonas liriopis TaxID=2949094 RepID=A0A9X2HS64_9SPHN|nr:hypothetical protein [Sphingomonas liriopis]MCP3734887.1 hypothetical protein [Sphingomonas liriopis]
MTKRTKTIAALLLAPVLLAACSRSEPEQPVEDTNTLESVEPMANAATEVEPVEAPVAEPSPLPDANTAAIDVPPEAPVKPDVQVLDDADATGMTARVTRDEVPPSDQPANDPAPQ